MEKLPTKESQKSQKYEKSRRLIKTKTQPSSWVEHHIFVDIRIFAISII